MAPNAKVAPEALAVLNTIRICEKFNTLPQAGGLYDQDGLFVFLLQNVLVWDSQRAELDSKKSNRSTTS